MNEKGVIEYAVLAFLTIFSFLMWNGAHGFSYHVKDHNCPVRNVYAPAQYGDFDQDNFRKPEVQFWSYILARKKWSNIPISSFRVKDGIVQMYCKRGWFWWEKPEWRNLACSSDGSQVYVGAEMPVQLATDDVFDKKLMDEFMQMYPHEYEDMKSIRGI